MFRRRHPDLPSLAGDWPDYSKFRRCKGAILQGPCPVAQVFPGKVPGPRLHDLVQRRARRDHSYYAGHLRVPALQIVQYAVRGREPEFLLLGPVHQVVFELGHYC